MSDLRFGRSETNIRMVRTFAFFLSDQIIVLRIHSHACSSSVPLKEHSYSRFTELGVVSVVTQKRNAI